MHKTDPSFDTSPQGKRRLVLVTGPSGAGRSSALNVLEDAGFETMHHLAVSIQSFSYKRGLPRSVDIVHDCRFLRNPYWDASLRGMNGTDAAVQGYVGQDSRFEAFSTKVLELSQLLLPAYRDEGKSYIAIAFGCTGGQHRSVTLAEDHALRLADAGWQVSIRHRELDRQYPSHPTGT